MAALRVDLLEMVSRKIGSQMEPVVARCIDKEPQRDVPTRVTTRNSFRAKKRELACRGARLFTARFAYDRPFAANPHKAFPAAFALAPTALAADQAFLATVLTGAATFVSCSYANRKAHLSLQ